MLEISAIIVLIINLYVTYKLYKSDYYEKHQKIYQTLIIWLLPILGFLIVMYFLSEDDKITKGQNNSGSNSVDNFDGGGGGD